MPISVEVLDGDSSFEFASDLLVRLAGGILTDIVFAADAAEVTKDNLHAVQISNIIQFADCLVESAPFFELNKGLAEAEREVLSAQAKEGGSCCSCRQGLW